MCDCNQRQAGDKETGVLQIEVTPEMIEAGLYELREHSFGENMGDVIGAVYVAMALASVKTTSR
jgi:hypothetical protein